jgi:hypothetical protein
MEPAQVVAEALRPIRDAAANQPLVIVAMLRAWPSWLNISSVYARRAA